jgi:hypothetical protein
VCGTSFRYLFCFGGRFYLSEANPFPSFPTAEAPASHPYPRAENVREGLRLEGGAGCGLQVHPLARREPGACSTLLPISPRLRFASAAALSHPAPPRTQLRGEEDAILRNPLPSSPDALAPTVNHVETLTFAFVRPLPSTLSFRRALTAARATRRGRPSPTASSSASTAPASTGAWASTSASCGACRSRCFCSNVARIFRSDPSHALFPSLGPSPRSSTDLDKWTAEQIKLMTIGGNDAGRQFFRDKGWEDGSAKVRAPPSSFVPLRLPPPSSPHPHLTLFLSLSSPPRRSTRSTPRAPRRCTTPS